LSYITGLGLSGNWFQVVIQLILLLLLDSRNRFKALASYRVVILIQVIHSSNRWGIIRKFYDLRL